MEVENRVVLERVMVVIPKYLKYDPGKVYGRFKKEELS